MISILTLNIKQSCKLKPRVFFFVCLFVCFFKPSPSFWSVLRLSIKFIYRIHSTSNFSHREWEVNEISYQYFAFCLRLSQFNSVVQSCLTLWDTMNPSTPGLPVHHHLPEFTQIHVHRVSDAIQLSHPLSSPFPPSIRVFSNKLTLCMRWPKYWSFSFSIIPSKEIPGLISPEWTGWIFLQSNGLSRVFSNTTVQKHQFFSAQPSSQSNSHIHTWPQEKP